ncbi:CHAT domain-containing protein [Geomonas nitrogeniifigens]|uniref:CHAT domain-containing protein n=1 Tax=Geomonas diazotrophica TaxID=2843197 RepID=UPI001C2B9B52|nr:CHAT domain-containing protein [Geomonas nitrogeniifigens]QXE87034.1 CHAT domain-containing protein [Geomonas nitrogeniifigens]
MGNPMNAVARKITLLLALAALLSGRAEAVPLGEELLAPAAPRPAPRSRPEVAPTPAVYTPQSVLYATRSRDGRWIATVEKGDAGYELWLHPAGNVAELPRLLSKSPVRISAPAFNAAGTQLAYADERDDLKGDIWLLDLARAGAEPRRLTGNDAGEDAPGFSPDGSALYYQRQLPGAERRDLVRLELGTGKGEVLPIGIDAAFAAASPDGNRIAFVSRDKDPGGDLWLWEKGGRLTQLTTGAERDLYPVWQDGETLLFTRFAPPTGDAADGPDGGAVFRLQLKRDGSHGFPAAFPLTSGLLSTAAPVPAGDRVLFVAGAAAGGQVLSLPVSGEVPDQADPAGQWQVARVILERQPADPATARLACLRVLAREEAPTREGALASLALAGLMEQGGERSQAQDRYAEAAHRYTTFPESSLAAIARLRLEAESRCEEVVVAGRRKTVIAEAQQEMLRAAQGKGSDATARALVDGARLQAEYGSGAEDQLAAIARFEKALAETSAAPEILAEAAYRRARLLARIEGGEGSVAALVEVAKKYDRQEQWAEAAIAEILDQLTAKNADARERLAALAEQYRANLPRLAMGAWNRVGDLAYRGGDWVRAKDAYRTVLEQFPAIATPTAAARFALAEILYREERYGEATALYEKEMGEHPEDAPLYQLARAAYLRKSLAAGESLYRLGEVSAARAAFLDLIRYEGKSLEAHRGYIKSVAAQGQARELLELYKKMLQSYPEDPVLLYGAGFCYTYLPGKESLKEGDRLIARAAERLPGSEYPFQTRGYIAEVLETVHGERGGLERALNLYRRAKLLNHPQENPENSANLSLNIGNIAYLLGRNATAWSFYSQRLAAKVPFDNVDTELLFEQRYGAVAFQVGEKQAAIDGYGRALKLAESRLEPARALEQFGRLTRRVNERLFAGQKLSPQQEQWLAGQQAINAELELLGADRVEAPPAAGWRKFEEALRGLLVRQRKLSAEACAGVPQGEKYLLELNAMASAVERELDNVPRLVETGAELHDRLGLANFDAERFEQALAHFDQAYRLNRALGRHANLAANRRSASISAYRQAETASGAERQRLLALSRDGFTEVLALLDQYPPEKKSAPKRGGGLINVAANVALDKGGSTEAAFGFSAEQERRLAQSYLARIAADLGDNATAEKLFKELLGRYPERVEKLAEGDLFGVGLLSHRAAQLAYARGDRAAAAAGFKKATAVALRNGNAVGAMLNLVNWGMLLPEDAAPGEVAEFLESQGTCSALADTYRDALPPDAVARYGNDAGAILARLAAGRADEASRQALLYKAVAAWDKVLKAGAAVGGANDYSPLQGRHTVGARLAARLNRAATLVALGLSEAAQAGYTAALAEARAAGNDAMAWRAQAALGDYDAALKLLDRLPPTEYDLRLGELAERFAPRIEALTAKDPEQGFALVERLSELERVQILGRSLLGVDDGATVELLRKGAPHLAELDRVSAALGKAAPEDAAYLKLRAQQEQTVLDGVLGKKLELLPPYYAVAGPGALRLAASSAALSGGSAGERERFAALLASFRKECASGKGAKLCQALAPQPAEAIDVMERLAGRPVLRLVPLPGDRFLVFAFDGKDGFKAETLPRSAVAPRLNDPALVALYERPEQFASANVLSWGVSASQLLKSVAQRRPLRTQVLDPAGVWPTLAPFTKLPADALPARLPDAHTLALPAAAGLLPTVPNRPGDGGTLSAAWEDAGGVRRDLVQLADGESVSLLLAPRGGAGEAWYLGQLATLVGVPSLLLSDRPADLTPFAKSYALRSLAQARRELPAGWLLIGDWGGDAGESALLAKKLFNDYVKRAVQAHNDGRYAQALALFDNALVVADATPELAKNRAALHRHARESAFGAGLTERAVAHAELLVQRLAKEKPYSAEHADALLRLGLLQGRLEHFKEATAALKEGVSIFADLGLAKDQAAALSDFGVVMENAVDYPAARSLFEEAAGLRAQLKDELNLADQYRNLGRIFDLRLNQFAVAERYYQKAQELYAKNGNQALEAETILERGRCQRLLGNFPSADALYREALAKVGSSELKTRMRIVLEQGNNAWFQGRYQEAFDLREQVEKAALKESWALEQVMAKNTGGLIWWTLGDNRRALVELKQALELAGKLEVRRDESATTLNNIGLVRRESGDYQGALESLGQALSIDRALGSRWAIAYDLRNLGQTRLKMGDPAGALKLLAEAAGLAEAIGDKVNQAKIHLALGDARARSNMNAPAAESYTKALELADAMLLREVRWRALLGLARLKEQGGDREGAVASYRQALETVEGLRAEIRLDQLKDGFLADKMDVYQGLVGLLVDLKRHDEAFAVAERSRARNLIDILGRQRLSLSGGADQDLYDRQNRLREQIQEQEQLAQQAATPAERTMYAGALDKLRADYQDLLLDIERRRPELLALVKVTPVTAAEVQALLEPGVSLLSYYQLPDRLLCWRLERQGSRLFVLKVSARELADRIATYRRMLQNLEPLEQNSRELYRLLLSEPLSGMPEGQTIGIVPHGSLHYLSFATLYDGRDYLVDRHTLFHLPAASVYRHTLARRQAQKNLRILAIGNPDLGNAALDLPFAEKEAGTLRWNYSDVTTLTRERATESWVRENIAKFGIIHLASHGEFDTVNPLFSSIRLAKDGKNDGRLQAEEVFGLDIKADLVVLSACQTGLGDVKSGDDVIGMNRAFLFAGTHALVSSLWRVSDVSSAILMKQFYRDYGQNDKAQALRLAMLHVRNRYPHPGYWGAFVLTGDYK